MEGGLGALGERRKCVCFVVREKCVNGGGKMNKVFFYVTTTGDYQIGFFDLHFLILLGVLLELYNKLN